MPAPRRAAALGRRTVALAWIVALCAVGCASTPYDAYLEAHPDWTPALPEARSAEEVVAAFYGPDGLPGVNVVLEELVVYDVASRPWRRIAPRALQGGGYRDGELVVIARRLCRAPSARSAELRTRVDYYVLRDDQPIAYAYTRFGDECVPRERFRAARAADAALELDLLERIRRAHGRRTLEVVEMYGRGLAYLEAGRMVEAKAWLEVGEGGEKAVREAAEKSDSASAQRTRADLEEATALRARLRRALGLEPAPLDGR